MAKQMALSYVSGACPLDCPDTCAWLVGVDDSGRAVDMRGHPEHPITRGALCTKVSRYLERTYHPDRILHPLKRVGPKGSGQFKRITWEEALSDIAARLSDIVARYGGEAVLPYSYSGTLGVLQNGSMDRRFTHALGATRLARTLCADAGYEGYVYTIGATIGTAPEDFAHARLILLWGTNTLTSNMHLWPFVLEARRKAARVIVIDPVRTRTAKQADEWIPIVPGTDAALALAMMHVIVRDNLWDRDYVERYTLGFERLRERVREWPPERAATITGIPAGRIEALAHEYATTRPAAIRINYGLQRHGGGGMAVRAITCLPALIGSWRERGGGVLLSTSGAFPLNKEALKRPDLMPHPTRVVNAARLGDALATDPRIRARAVMSGNADTPIHALIVYSGNPAATNPDQNAVLRGLAREDLFTVVIDHFITDTADYADIFLPATTQVEHWDLHTAYGHYYLALNRPAIAPLGESRPDTEIFRLLAERLGLNHPAFRDSDEDLIRQALDVAHPWMAGITFERLLEEGFVRLNLPEPFLPFAGGNFFTPSGKCEFYSEAAARDGLDPLPTFHPPHEIPFPGREERESGHLALLSPSAHYFLNTNFANVERMARRQGEIRLLIHPDDAAKRGIADGDWVRVWNERGELRLRARVSDDVRRGVCYVPSVWWRKFAADGQSANVLTSQAESDMGGGATFYDVAVRVERTEPPARRDRRASAQSPRERAFEIMAEAGGG